MNNDDDLVLGYLGKYPKAFVSPMEVCKRATDRKRFAAEPDWAKAILARLTQQRVLECNAVGHYRIKSEEEEERKKHGRPYEPRPEPAAQAQPVGSEQKVEATAKPQVPVPSKEGQKGAPAQVGENGAEVVARNAEAKADPSTHVAGHKDGKALSPPPQAGGYSQISKKAA